MALSRRDSELLLFDELNAVANRGGGAALLISGAVGTGKTALVQEMTARAVRQGGAGFLVTASAGERGHPFGVLDRLVRSMCAAGMDEPFPGGMDGGEAFFAMMDQVSAAIRAFAARRPVVIGIDDVHFADTQSLRCLRYLIWRIESSGVVIVLTESSSYERDMAELRAEMLPLPFCHRLRLTPLTSADIADQVTDRFGGAPDEAFVRFCAEVGGGIPLLVHALIDDRAAAPGPAWAEPGAGFRQAVLRSLHRCAPATAAIARAMAVLGDHADPALVAELGGVDVALVEEGVRDLTEMGLVDGERFRHPRTRSAVLAGVPVPNLPELHSRAAELLHESGAPAIAVAKHLIAGQGGGTAPWRVTILCEAAREALAAGDVDTAVSCLRHAIGASGDETQRAQVGVLAADAQWHADPGRAARRLDELCQDAWAGRLNGHEILVVVNQLLWWGDFAEADKLLRLGAADDGGDSSLAQLWAFFRRADPVPDGDEEPGRPADSPLAHSGPMAAATYLSSAASMAYDGTDPDRADQMLMGIRAGAPLTPALYALVLLVRTGRSDEATAWCDRLLKEDWIAHVPMRRAMIGTIRSVAALRGGDSAAAFRGIREVFDLIPPQTWGVVVGLPLSVAVRAATDLGDAPSAQSYLATPVPPAMFDTPFALPYLQALGRYHRAMGHPQSALTHARSCLELMTRWQVGTAGVTAEIEWHHEAAAAPAGELDHPGASHRHRGPGADAPDPADGARLTDAEQRVAALAAAGNTNREIAEYLFITVSTVEQHLTKVYRKLNVRSRSALRRRGH